MRCTLALLFLLPLVLATKTLAQAKISGQVTLSGDTPEVVRVTLFTPTGGYIEQRTLMVETSFQFTGLGNGTYEIRVDSPGFESTSQRVVVSSPVSRYEVFVRVPLGKRLAPRQGSVAPEGNSDETVSVKTLAVPPDAVKEMKKAEQAAEKGKTKKAIQHLEKALEIFPDFAEALNNLAVQYLSVGEPDNAETALQQSFRLNPEDATVLRNLAQLYLAKPDPEAALEKLDQALALEPGHSKTLLLLGETYLAKRDCGSAMDYFLAAVEANPEDHSYLGIGQCYLQQGKTELAVEEFKKFLSKNPSDPRAKHVEAYLQEFKK